MDQDVILVRVLIATCETCYIYRILSNVFSNVVHDIRSSWDAV